jgi:hypothetical protein
VDESTEDVTQKMRDMAASLLSQKPTLELSEDSKALHSLALRCANLADEIIALLEKTKAKKAHSLRDSIKATGQKIRTKEKLVYLQENLDRYRGQLFLQWTVIQKCVKQCAEICPSKVVSPIQEK